MITSLEEYLRHKRTQRPLVRPERARSTGDVTFEPVVAGFRRSPLTSIDEEEEDINDLDDATGGAAGTEQVHLNIRLPLSSLDDDDLDALSMTSSSDSSSVFEEGSVSAFWPRHAAALPERLRARRNGLVGLTPI